MHVHFVKPVINVKISRRAQKQLKKAPLHISEKLLLWVRGIKKSGLEVMRRTPGYHDEPLKGQRFGQRSIRLNKAYRAIYIVKQVNLIEFVSVEEVSKHEY